MTVITMSIHMLFWMLACIKFQACAFSTTTTGIPRITDNNNVVGANSIFEFLKWGGSTPDFDVIEKTKEYLSYTESRTNPDPSWYHKDYVLRGVVIGPINQKDLRETQAGFDLMTAFPDIRIESFGHTVDPENPYRCFYFQRWRATHTGILKVGVKNLQPTYNNIECPVSVFSVVWTPEQKIIYEQVGAVVDRFEGNTQGKAAVFGLLHGAGQNLPGSPGSLFLRVAQRLGHIVGTVGRAFSKEEDIPSWWTSKSRGFMPIYEALTGYLGIDIGTQGLSVTLTDEHLKEIATGDATYDFVECLDTGCYEQRCEDWDHAVSKAMKSLREKVSPHPISVLSIGIAGQMHGEVLVNAAGEPIQPVRLWCDARNEDEGHELTNLFKFKVPKRATAARFLWTTRNRIDVAVQTAHITTPAGWMAYRLTGEFTLGIGDAAGMFPIDSETLDYDAKKLKCFDALVNNCAVSSLISLLPKIRRVGEDAGILTEKGAAMLGIDVSQIGIPVAAAEGDQVAALAGSLIGNAGTMSCCFGTSVCANVVGDRAFEGVSAAVDHFCAADGKPINMVWLRNGTTFLNTIVKSYSWDTDELQVDSSNSSDTFTKIMQLLVQSPDDCGGLLSLPFMDDEPGLGVTSGGSSALIVGWNPGNAKVGNIAKAALLSTMFNLRIGCTILMDQGFPRTEIVLTGGLSKTLQCGQILSNVFDTAVTLFASADEGCAWGAAVIAKYRYLRSSNQMYATNWETFLDSIASGVEKHQFFPDPIAVAIYNEMFQRYKRLMALVPELRQSTSRL